jgi:predicted GIY-YIG superfamily endonuclease
VDVREAIERERQIKRWSRAKEIALIKRVNPRFLDLSDGVVQARDVDASPANERRQ